MSTVQNTSQVTVQTERIISERVETDYPAKCGACCCSYVVGPLTIISMVATGIIGTLGVIGIAHNVTLSTFLVVSSSLTLTSSLLLYSMSQFPKEKTLGAISAIASVIITVVGALGAAYIIHRSAVGWVCIGSSLATLGGATLFYKNVLK